MSLKPDMLCYIGFGNGPSLQFVYFGRRDMETTVSAKMVMLNSSMIPPRYGIHSYGNNGSQRTSIPLEDFTMCALQDHDCTLARRSFYGHLRVE